LGFYGAHTLGVQVGLSGSIRLDMENEPQPDGAMIILPAYGGSVEFEDDYVVGGPDLAGEISASTVSIDLHKKQRVYKRNQVKEYIVWRVLDEAIDWFVLHGTQFDKLAADATGFYRSEVFPGLWLDASALAGGDLAQVLAVLQQGIASPEHAVFVRRLQEKFSQK